MGFFESLRRVLGGESAEPTGHFVIEGGGLAAEAPELASPYDRAQWHKKLKRILEALPESRGEWGDLAAEAKALELDPAWVTEVARGEFLLLVRRAVSDRIVTVAEHRKLDLARDLIGIPDAEAEATLHAVVAEAELFFGKPVDEG